MTDMTVANTIWQQIKTDTKMACGARSPVGDTDKVQFNVTITRGVTHKVVVTLDKGTDTYGVQLVRIRGVKVTTVEEMTGVYVGELNGVIYRMCNK
jgi:hypothetical protein